MKIDTHKVEVRARLRGRIAGESAFTQSHSLFRMLRCTSMCAAIYKLHCDFCVILITDTRLTGKNSKADHLERIFPAKTKDIQSCPIEQERSAVAVGTTLWYNESEFALTIKRKTQQQQHNQYFYPFISVSCQVHRRSARKQHKRQKGTVLLPFNGDGKSIHILKWQEKTSL